MFLDNYDFIIRLIFNKVKIALMKDNNAYHDKTCDVQKSQPSQDKSDFIIKKIGEIKPAIKMAEIIRILFIILWGSNSLYFLIDRHIIKGAVITQHIVEINVIISYILVLSIALISVIFFIMYYQLLKVKHFLRFK
jgi:hypothetical protein